MYSTLQRIDANYSTLLQKQCNSLSTFYHQSCTDAPVMLTNLMPTYQHSYIPTVQISTTHLKQHLLLLQKSLLIYQQIPYYTIVSLGLHFHSNQEPHCIEMSLLLKRIHQNQQTCSNRGKTSCSPDSYDVNSSRS